MTQHCEILIIGGSAGSLDVLLTVLPDLKADLAFAIILVLHRKSGRDNMLTELLRAKTWLRVKELEEKEQIKATNIYIVPPNYHLLIENNRTFSLDVSEKVNFSRPSIDVTFESAAEVFRENLVCLLLSGSNSDGTDGSIKVKENGGKVFVQNPVSAGSPFMPQNAKEHGKIDAVLNIEEIAEFINHL